MMKQDLCVNHWTFDKGIRAQASDFSIAIPDGWNVFETQDEGERTFCAYPEGVTRDDIEEMGEYAFDGLVYCPHPSMDEGNIASILQENGIDELLRALKRTLRDGNDNPMAESNLKVDFVMAKNCYVMVSRVNPNAALAMMLGGQLGVADDDGPEYEIQIVPCMASSCSFLRLRCTTQDASDVDAAFDAVRELAKTIEVAKPVSSELASKLVQCKTAKVGVDFFTETVVTLANTLDAARSMESSAAQQRFVRDINRAYSSEQTHNEDVTTTFNKLLIGFLADYSERTIHYAFDLLDALQHQKSCGASEEDVHEMAEAIGDFMILYEVTLTDDDPAAQAAIDSLGNVPRPQGYEQVRDLIEMELPGYKTKHDAMLAEDAQGDSGANQPAQDDSSVNVDAAMQFDTTDATPNESYGTWWDPFPKDREPYYVSYNGRFDHAAACWLLYNDILFFQDGDITWDGKHHSITGVQLNAAKQNEVPVLMERASNYIPGFAELMMEVEKDEGLIVPKAMIHKAVRGGIGENDLTGITLMSLQTLNKVMAIMQNGAHEYAVLVDTRVSSGIPSFLNLVGRLIWDLRAYNGVEQPFSITLLSTLNVDANAYFGDTLRLDKPVVGASSENSATFDSKPIVNLPSLSEVKDASRPFASGFDNPDDMQGDEQLFEGAMMSLMRSFPLTVGIEGTHHLGRAARIEDVKVGDKLVLAADWQSEYFTPCCIEVFNDRGETLGNLHEYRSVALTGNRELALLLPRITATVESVTPLSKRRKNAKYALMDVRMELDESVAPDEFGDINMQVIQEAKRVLRLPKNERITMSHSSLSVSDLKGNINKDSMPDESPAVSNLSAAGKTSTARISHNPASESATSAAYASGSATESNESLSEKYHLLSQYAPADCMLQLDAMTKKPTTGSEFVELSERIVGTIIQKRQRAFSEIMDAAQSPSAGITPASLSIISHNDAILECFNAYIDIIEKQLELGASSSELKKMLDEAGEVEELLRGGTVMNIVANSTNDAGTINVPAPKGIGLAHGRLAAVRQVVVNSASCKSEVLPQVSTNKSNTVSRAPEGGAEVQQRSAPTKARNADKSSTCHDSGASVRMIAAERTLAEARKKVKQATVALDDARKELARFDAMQNEMERLRARMREIEAEIKNLGIFDRKKKKAAKQELASLEGKLNDLRLESIGRNKASNAVSEAEDALMQAKKEASKAEDEVQSGR